MRNFYLNKGYYDVEINSSFAKLISEDEFELTFKIKTNKKFFFDKLSIEVPEDFDVNNYSDLNSLFKDTIGKPYSFNLVEKILDKIDLVSLNQQYQNTKANVVEDIIEG